MNILILNWRDPKHPNAGGAEQVTLEHAKGWKKAGHNVWWFTASFKGAKKKEEIEGVKIIRSGGQFFDVQLRAFFWYFLGKHPKFDLVVDQFHGIPFFTPLYVRAKKLAFIHEVAKEVWKLNQWPDPYRKIPAILGPIFEPLVFKLFYKKVQFMTVSDSTRNDLIEFGIPTDKIKVIESGVILALPDKLPEKENKKTAMFLGAISEDKGIFDTLRVFSEIEKKEEGWQFWVVGKASPALDQKTKSFADDLDLKSVKFWGYVSEDKKFRLLARAHVLVNTSIREGWGLVNIEAAACGTPVFGYNVAGVINSVKDRKTGILVDKGNYEDLADEVLNLIDSEERYKKMQREAKRWARKFSWKKAKRESLELIESL